MPSLDRVLIATDFSERAARAEASAARLCVQQGSRVAELLTVHEAERVERLARLIAGTSDAARAMLNDAATQALDARLSELQSEYGLRAGICLRFGGAAPAIAERADELDADLVAIGAHGGGFFSDLFLGNTADRLARLLQRPLLVVKNAVAADYQRVLVPVDFSPASRKAAQLAMAVAPGADITFLHAYEAWFEGGLRLANVPREAIEQMREAARAEATQALDTFIAELGIRTGNVSRILQFGPAGRVVREQATSLRPDLIVMGKHGRTRLAEFILGSVTRDTLQWAPCDVLVAHGAAEAVPRD